MCEAPPSLMMMMTVKDGAVVGVTGHHEGLHYAFRDNVTTACGCVPPRSPDTAIKVAAGGNAVASRKNGEMIFGKI